MKKILLLAFACHCLINVSAQVNINAAWTWVKGSKRMSLYPEYGTTGVASPNNVPGGRRDFVSWQDAAGDVWIFGGFYYYNVVSEAYLNDIWKYSPGTNQWTFIRGDKTNNSLANYGTKGVSAPTNQPGSRTGAVSWTDASGNFYLFGGFGYVASGGTGRLNDVWKYDPVTNEWTWIGGDNTLNPLATYGTINVSSAANIPGSRDNATVWQDNNGDIWMYGGRGFANAAFGNLNDLWRYSTVTNEWTWVQGPNLVDQGGLAGPPGVEAPGIRPYAGWGGTGWVDASNKLWYFGPETIGGLPSLLWRYDPTINQWAHMKGLLEPGGYGTLGVPGINNLPRPRSGAISWSDLSGNLWLFGGSWFPGMEPANFNDLWRYNPVTTEWTWMSGEFADSRPSVFGQPGVAAPGNTPGGRGSLVSWRDLSGAFYMTGGTSGYASDLSSQLNETWKYDPSTNLWAWVHGDTSNLITENPGIIGVSAPGNTPGGKNYAMSWSVGNDLYLMDGLKEMVTTVGFMDNDMWRFNTISSEWTWIKGDFTSTFTGVYGTLGVSSPFNIPPPRRSGATWNDAAGNLWLFGGTGQATISWRSDLWRFNTSTTEWTWVKGDNNTNQSGIYGTKGTAAPTNKPGARSESATWKDASNNLWLFGGVSGLANNRFNDLWKYDPVTNNWTWMNGANASNQLGTYGTINTPNAANTPGARNGAFTWVDNNGIFWLYAGVGYGEAGGSGYRTDLWKYDPTTNEWTWVNGSKASGVAPDYGTIGVGAPTNNPGSRAGGANWVDNNGDLWLFGGISGAGNHNDLWKYERGANQWIWVKGDVSPNQIGVYQTLNVSSVINKPGSRNYPSGFKDAAGNFWLFGGQGLASFGAGRLNDLWKISSESLLPLRFITFNGQLVNNDAKLAWKTENETNTLSFIVERSVNGRDYIPVGQVAAKNIAGIQMYTFTDPNVVSLRATTIYYRLKQKDIDQRYSYSAIIPLSFTLKNQVSLYPNPVSDRSSLNFTVNRPEKVQVRIVDHSGKVLKTTNLSLPNGSSAVTVDFEGMAKGIYYLDIKGETINKLIKAVKQ